MKDKIYEIGCVVGRFQIDKLHAGHIALLEHVNERHNKFIIFLGVAVGEHKEKQALGFASREKMIKAAYPNAIIVPIQDNRDDNVWSKNLDIKVREIFQHGKVKFYGGRDSFIKYYTGRFECEEISNAIEDTATGRRLEIKSEIRDSEDFRAGIIHHAANTYPNVFPAVDVAIIKEPTSDIENRMLLLGRKPGEELWRFPGGHVDPEDLSYEAAAKREAHEEVGSIEISDPEYICSLRVDDWRYRSSKNKITTALYKFTYCFGNIKAADDLEECKWFDMTSIHSTHIIEEHRPLILELKKKVKSRIEGDFIPNRNIKERYK